MKEFEKVESGEPGSMVCSCALDSGEDLIAPATSSVL